MIQIFETTSYKEFVQKRVKALPGQGRGEYRKIAEFLRIHTTLVSQIFNGDRQLTQEQALSLTEYFGLSELETDYFLELVNLERAGTSALQKRIRTRLRTLSEKALEVGSRLPNQAVLTQSDQAMFYSNWYFSGIRLLTSIEKYQDIDSLSVKLGFTKQHVRQVLDFLISVGLIQEKDGRLVMGPARTHLPSDSLLVTRHHTNWRLKAIERFGKISQRELNFTSPLTISAQDFPKVRAILLKAIEEVSQIVAQTQPSQLGCLNIDWFEVV